MENINNQRERRKDLRVRARKPFMIKVYIRRARRFFRFGRKNDANVKNLSVSGVCLEIPVLKEDEARRVQDGQDSLVLELKLPKTNKIIKLKGMVSRIEKRGKDREGLFSAGIRFDDMCESDREHLLYELINMCIDGDGNLDK